MNSKIPNIERVAKPRSSHRPTGVMIVVHFMLQKHSAAQFIGQLGALHLFQRRKDPKPSAWLNRYPNELRIILDTPLKGNKFWYNLMSCIMYFWISIRLVYFSVRSGVNMDAWPASTTIWGLRGKKQHMCWQNFSKRELWSPNIHKQKSLYWPQFWRTLNCTNYGTGLSSGLPQQIKHWLL